VAGDVTSSERFEGERFSSAEDQHPARHVQDVMFARIRAVSRANCRRARAMDGAGSLTRSLFRSLRPQADLKAAAIGAVVLLREWLQDKRDERRAAAKIKTRAKAVVEREPPPRVVALVERYL